MRRADWAFLVPLLLVGIVTTAGARQRAPSLRDVRHAIESASSSCRLEVEEELHMGPTKLRLVRRLVARTEDADRQARAILDGLRRVEVGSYRITADHPSCTIPWRLEADLLADGWQRAARWKEHHNHGLILHHLDPDGGIDAMLMVEMDGRTLDVVRLEGRIHDLLSAAVMDDPAGAGALVGVD